MLDSEKLPLNSGHPDPLGLVPSLEPDTSVYTMSFDLLQHRWQTVIRISFMVELLIL